MVQADETPVMVSKDGRPANSRSYMWVYRTGKIYTDTPIILYEYQRTRKADHPREFLKDFSGGAATAIPLTGSWIGKIRISFLSAAGHMQDGISRMF